MFFSSVLLTLKQVVILYIMAAVGFAADKTGIYKAEVSKATNDLMFYVVTPSVIVNSFFSAEFSSESGKNFLTAVIFSVFSHIIGMALSAPFFNKKDTDSVVHKFAVVYANVGYMAIPLTQAILGDEGVFYASAAVAVLNIICFTHGIFLMNKGVKAERNIKTLVLNPGLIAVVIGLPFFLTGIKLPEIITEPVRYLSLLNTPLAMIMLGTYIARTNLRKIFTGKNRYLVVFLRNICVPAVVFLILKAVGISGKVAMCIMISASAPSANNTVLFSVKYGKNESEASRTVALSSVFAIITMPFLISLAAV